YDFNTYVLLKPGTNVTALQAKWDQFLEKERTADWEKYNSRQEFILRPMLGIHLYSNLLQESEPEEQGDGDAVYALSVIAFFILLIAWVNYINLATAKSFDRANEIGVRKVMGAQKVQLVKQFLAEALLVNLMATLLALVLVRVSWSFLNEFTGRAIPLSYLLAPSFWLLVLGLFVAGGALSGFYPAMVLSSFNPVSVLKGKLVRSVHGSVVRKSLVVFQFLASVFLICGSVVVYQQLQFMRQQKLGVDINQTLVLRDPGVVDSLYEQNKESFKNEMLRISGVRAVTTSSNVPGDEIFWTNGIRRLTGSDNALTVYNVGIDFDYVPAFGLELAAGRNFDRSFSNDRERVLINRELAASLAFDAPEEAIGQKLSVGGDTLEVAGVLENYHQMSLKTKVAPIVFRLVNNSSFYAFKMETENYQDVLDKIEPVWKDLFPGNPIEYFFLDQFFNRQYASDRQFGQLFSLFTILAIFVACLGLFGLASFMTVQRTKEIGIRKVMGSSVAGIIILLSKGFIQLVLIANLIAWPLAWWAMSRWLEAFPYHTTINPLLFLAAGCAVVFIAFLSVGLQTFKAASLNPSKSLKYE
ncbi:MAG: FtsX-like permease family protein, partial [Bacteroidia bacterium]|nr:FtsX-like permease family protein [Bacteroidia bacterium]